MNMLLLAFLPALGLGCGYDFQTWLDGRCFNIRFSITSFDMQNRNCKEQYNARLPSVRSQDENDQFFAVLRPYDWNPIDFWIDLYCDGEKFVWGDGSEATYTNFAGNYTCSPSTTGHRYHVGSDKRWYEAANGKISTGENGEEFGTNLVCEAPARSSSTCDEFDLVKWETSETCVGIPPEIFKETWQKAEQNCMYYSAHLPAIHDQDANDFFLRYAVDNFEGVLIGARKDKSGNFSWTDGSKMDYSNFAPGFPDETSGDCVAMQTGELSGQWKNIPCGGTHSIPYVCTKTPFYPTNPQPAGCPKRNNFAPGDEIYSPSYPLPPGVTNCDYFLIQPDSSKQAEIEISLLEINKCCDYLTVYDGLLGDVVLKNMTGFDAHPQTIRAKTNAIRLRWSATSGANVRGFKAKMNIT